MKPRSRWDLLAAVPVQRLVIAGLVLALRRSGGTLRPEQLLSPSSRSSQRRASSSRPPSWCCAGRPGNRRLLARFGVDIAPGSGAGRADLTVMSGTRIRIRSRPGGRLACRIASRRHRPAGGRADAAAVVRTLTALSVPYRAMARNTGHAPRPNSIAQLADSEADLSRPAGSRRPTPQPCDLKPTPSADLARSPSPRDRRLSPPCRCRVSPSSAATRSRWRCPVSALAPACHWTFDGPRPAAGPRDTSSWMATRLHAQIGRSRPCRWLLPFAYDPAVRATRQVASTDSRSASRPPWLFLGAPTRWWLGDASIL